jgi:hypothetical protein
LVVLEVKQKFRGQIRVPSNENRLSRVDKRLSLNLELVLGGVVFVVLNLSHDGLRGFLKLI